MTVQVINGMVFNNCTDSGLANVTVYLNINDGSSTSSRQTLSDANGNFSFDGVSIHSSSKYSYAIYIPSKSGYISSGGPTEIGINGTTLNFNYDEVGVFFKPRVTPKFLFCGFYCTTNKTSLSDSIIYKCSQYIYHKNNSNEIFSFGGEVASAYGDYLGTVNVPDPNIVTYYSPMGNYPMGKYIIEMDIWKSGVYTTRMDSVYLGWGSNTTYTINW